MTTKHDIGRDFVDAAGHCLQRAKLRLHEWLSAIANMSLRKILSLKYRQR